MLTHVIVQLFTTSTLCMRRNLEEAYETPIPQPLSHPGSSSAAAKQIMEVTKILSLVEHDWQSSITLEVTTTWLATWPTFGKDAPVIIDLQSGAYVKSQGQLGQSH
jgi:hypothetical protein